VSAAYTGRWKPSANILEGGRFRSLPKEYRFGFPGKGPPQQQLPAPDPWQRVRDMLERARWEQQAGHEL
jgi:hypothetical protein